MPTSVYFNNQRATVEQQLLEDLIIESIRNHGIDVYYLPRESQSSTDELFGDDPVKCYRHAIKIEMYLETFQNYEGNQEFFSKFGLELQETARLCMSRRSFERLVTRQFPESHHVPKEGDLVYLPTQFKLMEIKFVEEEKNFFQLGRDSKNPYMYGLSMEAFKYNGELLQTGVTEIDSIPNIQAYALEYQLSAGGTGTFVDLEWVYQGADLETATAKAVVADWDKPSRKLKLRNIKGTFVTTGIIKGSSSGAQWNLTTEADVMRNINFENIEDNERIEQEADNILDFSEANPFGES
jgi:hypothetical protein